MPAQPAALKWLARLLAGVPPILSAIEADMKAIGMDLEKAQHVLDKLAMQRLDKAILGGKKQAAGEAASVLEPEAEAALL